MTTATVPTIEQPSYFRPGNNEGAADIVRGKLLKLGAVYQGIALATSSSDKPAGVSAELMEGTTNGVITRDRQIGGQAMVLSGAPVAIGDDVTTDSAGRGIPATARNQSVWGRATTATTGANQQFAIELSIGAVSASGGLQMVEMVIPYTALTAAAALQELALATLPAGTWIVGYQVVPTALLIKSTATFALDIGYTGALEYCAGNLNVGYGGTVTTPQEAAVSKATDASRDIKIGITISTGNLGSGTATTLTAGSVTVRLFFANAVALPVSPT
jgi:hypothetical protein